MATVQQFEELEIWKTARVLTRGVYALTRAGAFSRDFGMRDQMQRAAVSVMNNIAEGFESRTQRVFIDLLGRARGSGGEVRSMLYIALDLGYISEAQFAELRELAEKVSRQIYRFIRYLESRPNDARVREDHADYEV